MKVRFVVNRNAGSVVVEPCDPDATLERSRVGQDILSSETFVAAISTQEFTPHQLSDQNFLDALAEAFALGQKFEQEVRRERVTAFD